MKKQNPKLANLYFGFTRKRRGLTLALNLMSELTPRLKFGQFFISPRVSWRDKINKIFRMFSCHQWQPKRMSKFSTGFTPSLKFGLFLFLPRMSWRDRVEKILRMFSLSSGKHRQVPKFSAGFTMAEMVVILSIMTTISAIILFSFTGLSERGAINRSARELALALRSAQGMALAVTQVGVGPSSAPTIPPAVGIKFIRGTNNYRIFADLKVPAASDHKYTDGNENIGDPKVMEKNVRVNSLIYYDTLGTAKSASAAHIIFKAPEATIEITDGTGATLGDGERLEIELSPSATASCEEIINPCKKISVRASGQINIK